MKRIGQERTGGGMYMMRAGGERIKGNGEEQKDIKEKE